MGITINYLAVAAAAVAAIALNALWYTTIFKGMVDRLRAGDPTIAGRDPKPPTYSVAIVGQIVMAVVLALVLELTRFSGFAAGMIIGALCWLGFTIPAMAQVQVFGYRKPAFLLVDGGVWLVNALVMGAILGAWQ
jgi:hypothetical protein